MTTINISTSSYNERRYGKPWIAKVSFATNPQGDFWWGTWIGDPGDAGLLEITIEDGDIVARGQKDTRQPKNSKPDWYEVINGELCALDGRADALKVFRANQAKKQQEVTA